MVKGGARTRSGPAASPDALNRQRDGAEWIKLPAKGYQGEIPDWPEHVIDQTPAEAELWKRLWRFPQAIVWKADGVTDTVALYVRCLIEASAPNASTAVRTLVRQQQDALLLSIPALHSAKYVIDGKIEGTQAFPPPERFDDATGTDGERVGGAGSRSARDRFTVVPNAPDVEE